MGEEEEDRKEGQKAERKEAEKKDLKGKWKSTAAKDDEDSGIREVEEIKAELARMAALPCRAPHFTHLEVKDKPLSPESSGSASGSSSGSCCTTGNSGSGI